MGCCIFFPFSMCVMFINGEYSKGKIILKIAWKYYFSITTTLIWFRKLWEVSSRILYFIYIPGWFAVNRFDPSDGSYLPAFTWSALGQPITPFRFDFPIWPSYRTHLFADTRSYPDGLSPVPLSTSFQYN